MPLRRLTLYGTLALYAFAARGNAEAFDFFDASIADSIPKLISGTGFYADMKTKQISADVTPFEVNAPLWTDGAVKGRFIAVPPGASVVYNDTADTYGYPDRAMIIKNFAVDIPGDVNSRILVETRFSGIRKIAGKDKWCSAFTIMVRDRRRALRNGAIPIRPNARPAIASRAPADASPWPSSPPSSIAPWLRDKTSCSISSTSASWPCRPARPSPISRSRRAGRVGTTPPPAWKCARVRT